jgi:predicted transcriptional regulator
MADKYSLRAQDIMTPAPEIISCAGTAADAIRIMRAKRIRSLIIDRGDENDAFGIVTYDDLVRKVFAKKLNPADVPICDICTKPLIVVNPNLRVEYVAQLFAKTGISHAPILSEHKLIGVISKTDLVENLF